jgi:hypothetical protein
MIAEMVSMEKEMVREILYNQLNMRKVCAKTVPKKPDSGTKGQIEKHLL